MKKLNIVRRSISVLVLIGLAIFAFFVQKDNVRLKLDMEKREALLSSSLNNDSTWMAKQDSIINIVEKSIFFVGDKKMDGDELVRYVNSLLKDYNNLASDYNAVVDSLQYYKQYFTMSRGILNSKFKAEPDTLTNTICYSISYTTPQDKEMLKLARNSKILELITQRYNINIKDLGNGSIVFESPQIDSALILLPYHRDELEYFPEKKCWIITRKL